MLCITELDTLDDNTLHHDDTFHFHSAVIANPSNTASQTTDVSMP